MIGPKNEAESSHFLGLSGQGSFDKRSVRRSGEDVASRVDISIMGCSAVTHPAPYSETCDTFRAADRSAVRTGSGSPFLIDLFERRAGRNRLVAQLVSQGRPARVSCGIRHAGSGDAGRVHIAHGDKVKVADKPRRQVMQEVTSRIDDARVNVRSLPFLSGALRLGKLTGEPLKIARVLNLLAGRKGRQILQAEVDSNRTLNRSRFGFRNLDAEIDVPSPARVLAKTGAITQLCAGGQF